MIGTQILECYRRIPLAPAATRGARIAPLEKVSRVKSLLH